MKKIKKHGIRIPRELPIANLPTLLRKCVEKFDNAEQQTLMAYSVITAVSGLLIKVQGTYDQRVSFPNLYFMVLGQAGTGKNIMGYSRQLLQEIHNMYFEASKNDLGKFKLSKNKKELPPPFRIVIIPGNTTQAKLLRHMADNNPDVPFIIIETEMDTISNAIAAEHGNFSSILRNGFHNENISKSIVSNSEYINIGSPKPAMALSGTPGQLLSLISNRDDGLLTRFLLKDFIGNPGWKNVGPSPDSTNLTKFFMGLSKEYFDFYNFISKESTEILLTDNQWEVLQSFGTEKLEEFSTQYGTESGGIVKRNGLILFKICMVLTSLRMYETQETNSSVYCTDEDFETAMFLMDQSLYTIIDAWQSLPDIGKKLGLKKAKFLESLKNSFTRAEGIELGKKLHIPERSADRYLRTLIEGKLLIQPTKGSYLKPEKKN